jgi:hypothetical protein
LRSLEWQVNLAKASAKVLFEAPFFFQKLFDDGVTRFLDVNKPIIYGTTEGDNLSSVDIEFNATALSIFKDNGVVIVGRDGDDTITGSPYSDKRF